MGAAIREVYFGNIRQAFNISDTERKSSGPGPIRNGSPTQLPQSKSPLLAPLSSGSRTTATSAAMGGLYTRAHAQSAPPTSAAAPPGGYFRPPPTDPRTQWELDNETQLLRRQVEAEERKRRRAEEARRRRDEEEARRLRRIVEQEESDRREAQRLADEAETDRLRKIYGDQSFTAPTYAPQQYHSPPPIEQNFTMHGAMQQTYFPPTLQRYPNGLYAQHLQQPRPGSASGWSADGSASGSRGDGRLTRQISSMW